MRQNDCQKLISVIVPVYNAEEYLNRCINSLLNQLYTNLEIIIINDGSTDASLQICEDFKNKDTRIKVINQVNAGVSAARNAGLDQANGDVVAFVDADDYLPNDAYENMMRKFSNVELVIGRIRYVDVCGSFIKESNCLPANIESNDFIFDLYEESRFSYLGYVWDKLFLCDPIRKYNIRFNPSVKLNEDRLFVLEYMVHCNRVASCNQIIYEYRQKESHLFTDNGRRIDVSESELTVIQAFEHMKTIAGQYSDELYYLVARKAFESSLDLLSRVSPQDRKRCIKFMYNNACICLKKPEISLTNKLKIMYHVTVKK